jgi:hypothetical protein
MQNSENKVFQCYHPTTNLERNVSRNVSALFPQHICPIGKSQKHSSTPLPRFEVTAAKKTLRLQRDRHHHHFPTL